MSLIPHYIPVAKFRFFQGADGSRQPTAKELDLAQRQGKAFYETVSKVNFA